MINRLIIDKSNDYIEKIMIYKNGDLHFEFKDGSRLDYYKEPNVYYYGKTIDIEKLAIDSEHSISRTMAVQIKLELHAIYKLINVCKYLSKNIKPLLEAIWSVFSFSDIEIIYYVHTNTFEFKVQSEIRNPLDENEINLLDITFYIADFELSTFDMYNKSGKPIDYITYQQTKAKLQEALALHKE